MAKKVETAKKSKKVESAVVKEIPIFYDKDEQLRTLKTAHFPKSRAGRMAYCDFQIEKWKVKRIIIETRTDPLAKKRKKREKLLAVLKKLEEELVSEEKANTEN